VLTGVGAVVSAAHSTPEDDVAVFGLGGVGMSAVLGARLARAKAIIAVDTVPEKLKLADDTGADQLPSPPNAVVISAIACCSASLTLSPCSRWALATLSASVRMKRR
jgi:Zn-dependent alcohol dehydrogenase